MSIVAAELIARVSADTGPADRELRNWSNRLGGSGGALGGITSVFTGNLLADGVKALGRGIADVGRIGASVFVDIASNGADFEAQMDSIAAVLGGTAEQGEALGDLAIQLGIDPNLKVDAQGAADAIYNLATAGLSVEEILGGAAEASVLLANATGGELGQAATVATDVMALFNISADDMMGAVDGIAGVTNASKFDLNDYALAIAQAGGVASQSGVDFEDFNAIIAATSPAFASGSDAGTSFKTFLQRLQPTTREAAEMMAELGLITEDGTSIFYDANGALKEMDDIVDIMNTTFGDMTEAQQSFYLGQLFGTDAMRTAGQVSKMTRKEYQALMRTMSDTDALDSAKIRTDNFKSAMENFSGSIEAIKLSIWDGVEPAAQMIVEALSPAVDWAAPQLATLAQNIGAWLEQEIPAVEVAVKTAYKLTGSPLASVMTGLAELTGAAIEFDATGIVSLDWGGVDMEFDAVGNVKMVWEGRSLGASASWGPDKPMEVEAHVNWGNVGADFKAAMFPDTGTAADLFKLPEINWEGSPAQLYLDRLGSEMATWLDTTAFSIQVRVGAKISEVMWGVLTHTYDVMASVTKVLWGIWEHIYPAGAGVGEVLWGAYEGTYDAIANVNDWINGIGNIQIPGTVYLDGYSGGGAPGEPIVNVDQNATGNPMFGGGWTWVGERGPELVRLPRASRIYDADDSAGMGGGVTVNQQIVTRNPLEADIYARKTADYLRRKQRH